jgi:hypothetical protein
VDEGAPDEVGVLDDGCGAGGSASSLDEAAVVLRDDGAALSAGAVTDAGAADVAPGGLPDGVCVPDEEVDAAEEAPVGSFDVDGASEEARGACKLLWVRTWSCCTRSKTPRIITPLISVNSPHKEG